MSALFEEVFVHDYDEVNQQFKKRYPIPLTIEVIDESDKLLIRSLKNERVPQHFQVEIYKDTPCSEFTKNGFVITEESGKGVYLQFARQYVYEQEKANYSETDFYRFSKLVNDFRLGRRESVFSLRTDEASATQYFQFYGYLSQQQNMMQDFIRTSTYQRSILSNLEDFQNKVVLDVGAGSGILSFFAVQAGARKVYAVEASSMAKHAQQLVASNKLTDRIQVVPGKIEEISLPEKVDVIISEPMGYMLFNERMLETYLHAKKWLKPNGNMFPTRGDLHISPFTDAQLYTEQLTKANFWYQQNFHGVDLTSLRDAALKEYFYQPVVDTFDIRICLAKSNKYTVDFLKAHEKDLHVIDIPLKFQINQTDTIHGLAFWFDVAFFGSQQTVWLSTSPTQALTHWYQVRCLIPEPILVLRGYTVVGRVVLVSNKRQSYNVQIELQIEGMPESRVTNSLDLKNPYFRYSGQPVQPPPGCNNTSPSEDYWQQVDTQMNGNAAPMMMNGGTNNTVTPAAQPMANGINMSINQQGCLQTGLVMLEENQFMSGQTPMPAHNNGLPSSNRIAAQSTVQPTNLSATSAQGYHGTVPMVPNVNPLGSILSSGNGSSTNVAGVNINFPVNQSLMIGDYAAAVSGQTIPPYKPI